MARNYSSVVEPKALTSNITDAAATQITLNNVTGLPSAPYVLVINPDTAKEEVVLVTVDQTGVTSPTLKVQRAIEASGGVGVARNDHTIGDVVKHMIVGSDLQIVHDHFSNESTTAGTAHGASGGVVGRTNSQTLTNKTIDLTDNTLRGTKAEFNASLEDADFTTIAGTETLTNKTLTSPTINTPTINSATLTGTVTNTSTLSGGTLSGTTLSGTTTATSGTIALGTNASAITANGATISATEVGYLDGVTSAVQTQVNTINTALTNNTPVGAVNMWVTGTAPTGWVLCQGQELAITGTYNALSQVIGTNYGALTNGSGASGTTHFRLPDLRGRVPMGVGTGRNVANSADLTARAFAAATFSKISDAENVTLTAAQSGLPQHNHSTDTFTTADVHYNAGFGSTTQFARGGGSYIENKQLTTTNSGPNAASESHTNTQPSTLINFIIKF